MNHLQCNKNINTELSFKRTQTIPPWLGRSILQLGQRRNKRKEKTTHTHIHIKVFKMLQRQYFQLCKCLLVCITDIECYDY